MVSLDVFADGYIPEVIIDREKEQERKLILKSKLNKIKRNFQGCMKFLR